MTRMLPLRSGYFQTPDMSDDEQADLLDWARSLVPNLTSEGSEWSYSHEKKDVQVCEDRQKGGMLYSVRGITTIAAALDDVMDSIVTPNTAEFRSLMKTLHRVNFLDAAVLYQREQNEAESLSVKWFAFKSHSAIALDQDFCILEYAGVLPGSVIGINGQNNVGVVLYESIEQNECPSMLESHKLERGSISRCGYLFRPTDEPGILEAQFICSIRQPSGVRSRRRSNRTQLLYWARALGNLQESINTRRISKLLSLRPNTAWVSDCDRQCCHLCLRTFTNIRRKHHCRVCGEIICSKCSIYATVQLPSVGETTLRICKSCSDGTKLVEITTENATANFKIDTAAQEAVNELALALPTKNMNVPDPVGLAWLKQLHAKNPEKREAIGKLLEGVEVDLGDGPVNLQDPWGAAVQDAPPEDIYDLLCDLASQALDCKFAVVSLVDENRQWFKSRINISEQDIPRDFSFCEYPVRLQKPMVVMDTYYDTRFDTNPFVTGALGIRFLAGAPLFTLEGRCVGSVCVLDTEPRDTLPQSQLGVMEKLAHLAMVSMQERREVGEQSKATSTTTALTATASRNRHRRRHHRRQPHRDSGASPPLPAASDYIDPANEDIPMHLSNYSSPEEAPENFREYEQKMIHLLEKSHETRKQVESNNTAWAQSAGLKSSAE